MKFKFFLFLLLLSYSHYTFSQHDNSQVRFQETIQSTNTTSDYDTDSPIALKAEIQQLGMLRFAQKHWEKVVFMKGSAELSREGAGILHLIGH